jgi:RHS repeat-associated protein
MTTGFDGSTYTYDAQNRLLSASKTGTTETFAYDGLNRQVSRTIGGIPTYNVYDGWELIGEYAAGAANPTTAYVSGAGGLVKNLVTNNYYYQDASGSTSHLADSNGNLIEWYRYDLQGTPIFYMGNNTQISASNYGIRHLFTGQQWYSELGLYDLRNRYYSPDIGRFLQADPTGFAGDATNLYRYTGNNPLTRSDPMGLDAVDHGGYYSYVANTAWVGSLVGSHIVNGNEWLQCAGAARYLGGVSVNGEWYNMPIVGDWYQGATLSSATQPGTVVVTGWGPDGGYLNLGINETPAGQTINQTAILAGWTYDGQGNYLAVLYSQNPYGVIHVSTVDGDDAWKYNEVNVGKKDGPYEGTPSTRSVANGNGASPGGGGINTRVPSIIDGVFYPYGFGNISPGMNFAGGTVGTINGAFTWTTNDSTDSPTLSNFGDINIGAGIGPGEPLEFEGRRRPFAGGDLKVVPHR